MQYETFMSTLGEDGSYLEFEFYEDTYSEDRHGFVIGAGDAHGRRVLVELSGKEAVELALALDAALRKAGGLK